MFGSQTLHPWCHSILIFPLDQAIHPLVRCKNGPKWPQGGDFQRQSLKLRYQTDRYKCTSSTHALYGSRTRHPSCESVLIIPLDQAIDSPARWEILEHVEFSTEKSEITLSNGQIQVYEQRTCIAWVTGTPFVVSKRAHHSVGSSNSPTCPLQN